MNSIIKKLLKETLNNFSEFEEKLENITTLDLEDDQVNIPEFNDETDGFIDQINNNYIYIRRKDEIPPSGPFELFILDVNDNTIGFIRGTKNPTTISFNLVFINEDNRGWGIATDIYKYFLDKGYIIKSDTEITQGTQNLYLKLVNSGYKPITFNDNRVGLKK